RWIAGFLLLPSRTVILSLRNARCAFADGRGESSEPIPIRPVARSATRAVKIISIRENRLICLGHATLSGVLTERIQLATETIRSFYGRSLSRGPIPVDTKSDRASDANAPCRAPLCTST